MSSEEHLKERYRRQITLPEVGLSGQEKLSKASVCIIGCGGLGVPVAMYLSAAGIGHLTLVDDDKVQLNNLHRQPVYRSQDVGVYKVEALKNELLTTNSETEILTHKSRFNPENAKELIAEADIVVDCCDNLETRFAINDACVELNIPFVSASIHRFEGQISVYNYQGGPSYRDVFERLPQNGELATCEETGILGSLTGILGTMQANEVLKMCLNIGEIISGKIQITNILNNTTSSINIEPSNNQNTMPTYTETPTMEISITSGELSDLIDVTNCVFIDIREEDEEPKIESESVKKNPLSYGIKPMLEYSQNDDIVVFCQTGLRSMSVAHHLRDLGFESVYSLKGGVESLENLDMFTKPRTSVV